MVDCTLERLYMEDYTVEELYVAFTVESSNMKDSHCGKTFYGGLYCESPILWTIALLTSIWRIVLRKVIDMEENTAERLEYMKEQTVKYRITEDWTAKIPTSHRSNCHNHSDGERDKETTQPLDQNDRNDQIGRNGAILQFRTKEKQLSGITDPALDTYLGVILDYAGWIANRRKPNMCCLEREIEAQ